MPNQLIAICSLVRNGMAYLPVYRRQLEQLQLTGSQTWHLYIVDGKSTDGTKEFLENWAKEDSRISIKQEEKNGEPFANRTAAWAFAANQCLKMIPAKSAHQYILWMEPDLYFPPETISKLLSDNVDVVAPIIYLGGSFYDQWAFRDKKGKSWSCQPPFHKKFKPFTLIEMQSVGSCVLFKRSVLDSGIIFKDHGPFEYKNKSDCHQNGLLVGICQEAGIKGFKIWADTGIAVLHPANRWIEQTWRPSRVSISTHKNISRTISTTKALARGLPQMIPLFEKDFAAKGFIYFTIYLFFKYNTNRLELTLKENAGTTKTYDMHINILAPSGIFKIPVVVYLILPIFTLNRCLGTNFLTNNKLMNWLSGKFHYNFT
ncbi:MAG TPA: glycosyltransferase, partial [Candidatus Gracilibacteria bacterium]|nr:glycosyltransferase [Candidatus Gracilibacteria bacterium]